MSRSNVALGVLTNAISSLEQVEKCVVSRMSNERKEQIRATKELLEQMKNE